MPEQARRLSMTAPLDEPGWNPRYIAYARAHGRHAVDQMAADEANYLGGRMAGFIVWINQRWSEWKKLRRVKELHLLGPAEHDDFDQWLKDRAA